MQRLIDPLQPQRQVQLRCGAAGGGAVQGGEGRRELRLVVGSGVVRACRWEELDLPHLLLRRRLDRRRSALRLQGQEPISLHRKLSEAGKDSILCHEQMSVLDEQLNC